MPTKAQLEEQLKEQQKLIAADEAEKEELRRQIEEAKRQQTHAPRRIEAAEDDGGSHTIDHMTILDNHMSPDTLSEPAEDIAQRDANDHSFWNNSWTWVHTKRSYGNKPEDSWFINPTPKLIAEVMMNAPTVFSACEVALIAGDHKELMQKERNRHIEFLREASESDLVSESLDLMTSYQSRYFEAVQRYIGLSASYDSRVANPNTDPDQLADAKLRKADAGAQCRNWAARLIALKEAYHDIVTDPRAYNLTFNFAPLPPQNGQPPTREYSLFRWAVTNTLNKIGRRLARSIKDGKMDAEQYRIPRPWLSEERQGHQLKTDAMLSDFA